LEMFWLTMVGTGTTFLVGLLISLLWPAKAEEISRIKNLTIFGAKIIADTPAHRFKT